MMLDVIQKRSQSYELDIDQLSLLVVDGRERLKQPRRTQIRFYAAQILIESIVTVANASTAWVCAAVRVYFMPAGFSSAIVPRQSAVSSTETLPTTVRKWTRIQSRLTQGSGCIDLSSFFRLSENPFLLRVRCIHFRSICVR